MPSRPGNRYKLYLNNIPNLIFILSSTKYEEADSSEEINIDLDLSTEVHHTVMDILEDLPGLHLELNEPVGDIWHRAYLQSLAELVTSPTASVCTLSRVMKLIRFQTPLLLHSMIVRDISYRFIHSVI